LNNAKEEMPGPATMPISMGGMEQGLEASSRPGAKVLTTCGPIRPKLLIIIAFVILLILSNAKRAEPTAAESVSGNQ
jgi:hypothetical protein